MIKCGYYTSEGEICEHTAEDKAEMVKHILAEHGTMEANEFLSKEEG